MAITPKIKESYWKLMSITLLSPVAISQTASKIMPIFLIIIFLVVYGPPDDSA
ncbi:MAG: hypothetical protein ABIQ54_00170 [Gammaproteobacteria bacterium]